MIFVLVVQSSSNVLFDPVHNSYFDLDIEKNPELANFNSILDFMDQIPIKKGFNRSTAYP
ncbi:hypothetical protein Hanom_Chr09g00773021 [Helianthus anomalus]